MSDILIVASTPDALARLLFRATEFLSREQIAQLATGAEIERSIYTDL